jgi:hypothetical protein
MEQNSVRGQRLRNEQLKIEEDSVYFHDIYNNTPVDYYELFNRNMNMLNNLNEDNTFINASQDKVQLELD